VILLDTHAWIWWLSDSPALSERARAAVKEAAGDRSLFVSSISAWELAMLVRKGRLRLTTDAARWIRAAEALPFLSFIPVDNAIAVRSALLKGLHPDPADRMILATALEHGLSLVTKDERLHAAGSVPVIW
jgi:PIN domain nuclease of toxin-antitoxin system